MLKIKFNKEELRRKYIDEGKHQWQLAEEYGCAVSVICTNLKDFGIKARPKCTPRFINLIKKEELEKRYLDAEPIDKLAISYGVSEGTIMRYLKDYGIPLHGRKGKYGSMFGKKNYEQIRKVKEWYKNPKNKERVITNTLKALRVPQNKAEKSLSNILMDLFGKSYKFVGNGKICIDGFFPDFINCNGQKKIIELYGDYWHNKTGMKERDKRRIKAYKKYGYRTLIVWEHELKSIDNLKKRLIEYNNIKNV
jgi:very-short-patch-repair endonuclease